MDTQMTLAMHVGVRSLVGDLTIIIPQRVPLDYSLDFELWSTVDSDMKPGGHIAELTPLQRQSLSESILIEPKIQTSCHV